MQIKKGNKPTPKLKLLLWIDKHIMNKWTFFWWDISQWFCNNNYSYKYSEFIERKIESPLSRRWHYFIFDQGLEPKPLSETSRRILSCLMSAYYE